MTKEITKAIILQRIQDKFKLRDFEPAPFLFDETVIPIYDIKPHLETMMRQTETLSVTATGPLNFFSVPVDEQWYLHRYNVIFVTGAYTIAGLFVGRPTSAYYTYLDLTAAQTVSYVRELPKDVKLNPGDRVYINVDGYTSTGDLTLICEVTREELR